MSHYFGVELEFSADYDGGAYNADRTLRFFQNKVNRTIRPYNNENKRLPNRFNRYNEWKMVEDCSASTTGMGLELRSPVLSNSRFKQVMAVWSMFQQNQIAWSRQHLFDINPEAHGLHVHFDVNRYARLDIWNFIKAWSILETPLLGISLSRDRYYALPDYANPVTESLAHVYAANDMEVCRVMEEQFFGTLQNTRYRAMNIAGLRQRDYDKGTVELRAPGATLNTDYLWSWIQIVKALLRSSKYGKTIPIKTVGQTYREHNFQRYTGSAWTEARAKQLTYTLARWLIAPRFMNDSVLTSHIQTLSRRGE